MAVFFIGLALIGGLAIGSHKVSDKVTIIERPAPQQIHQDSVIIQNLNP